MYRKSGEDETPKKGNVKGSAPRQGTKEATIYNNAVESGKNVTRRKQIGGGSKFKSENEDAKTSMKFDRKGNPKGRIKVKVKRDISRVDTSDLSED
jgi:hypothetical protein